MTVDGKERLARDVAQVEDFLERVFRGAPDRAGLYDAMGYSLLAGGKRVRPVLALEVCRMGGGEPELALPLGCAVEMVHTYSLIHDDLPAMDNDDLRRGKPTNHKVFGEATAILAGDGLLTHAFTVLAQAPGLSDSQRLAAVETLSRAAGPEGMVGGQALDMAGEGRPLDRTQVEQLQSLKTGALIRCAAHMGVIAAGGDADFSRAVDCYAQKLGLAFQVRDDMLDVEGTVQTLGKSIGSDAENEKVTFVDLLGLERCRAWVRELSREAACAISGFPRSEFLRDFAAELAQRSH